MVESAASLRKAMSDMDHEENQINDDVEFFYNKDFVAKCISLINSSFSWNIEELQRISRFYVRVDQSSEAQSNSMYL